jgi:hypothetical protein
VNWSTNIAANSAIDYGTSASYGASTPANNSMVTSHQMAVTGLATGTVYHFRVRSTDANNDLAVSSDMTFATAGDTTPPTVSITSPAANATLSGTANVSVTASDNVGVTSVQLKIDNANSGAPVTAAPYVIAVNTVSLSNGNHILTAMASDAAGNSATSAQVAVKVNNTNPDTTPPTVSISVPANGATVSGTVSVTANASDNVGVASVQFQLDGANFGSLDLASPYSVSWNTTTSSNGSHTLRAIAKDAAGNSTTSTAVTVTVSNSTPDTTPPTVSISAPANGATVSGTVSVTANASDNVGVASVQFQLDGANFGSLDLASPYSVSWNTTTSSNGSHTLRAIAKDAAGNSTTSATVTVTVSNGTPDTTPPTVSISAPANGATVSGTVSVTANASDNVGVASVQFQLDGANFGSLDLASPYSVSWNTTTSSNGSHTLRAIAKDAAGNSTTSATVTVTVSNGTPDTTPPTVSLTAPVNGATVSGTVSVTANASDNVGVASVQFQLDAGNLGALDTASPYTTSWDTTTASNGSHTLRAIAKDAAGNSTTSATVTVTVSNVAPPPPPPGSTITSFQVTSPLTGTFPFTVGLGFKKGDAPSGASLSVTNGQVVPKSSWSDGSVKTAIASGRAALVANTPLTVNVLAGGTSGGTAKTCADIQTAAPSASIQLGGIGTVSLSSLLANPFRTWVSGPEMVECHYRSAVGTDPTLQVWFHVRLYADGRMWVRAVAENGVLDVATSDKSYVPTVIIGGTTVFNNGGATLTNYANTRWNADGWIGGDPQITPKHDARYLEAAKLVPNYMNLAPSATALNNLGQVYTPMQKGGTQTDMSNTGFQDQIGILPLWDSMYITSNADPRAYASVIMNAKAINAYPIVWEDSATHVTVIPSGRPTWSAFGNNAGGGTAISAGPNTWDIAHHGSAGYLAYLITGDYYYLETLEDEASLCYLMIGSSNGAGTARPFLGQTRAIAWCFRTVGQLAGIGGNDTIPNDYRALYANSATHYHQVAQQPGMNTLGFISSIEADQSVYSTTNTVVAPWQQDFMTMSIGFTIDLEPVANMTDILAVQSYVAQSTVGRLGPNGTSNWCFTEAAWYNIQTQTAPAQPVTNYYPDWGTTWLNNVGSPNTSCGNTLGTNSNTSPPANAASTYWGNLLPAISYMVDHGQTGAAASWARLTGATNWSVIQNAGFGDTPIWGIVPRSGTTTQPPPPTTSVSVTAPATGATVTGITTLTASASSSAGIAGVQFQLDSTNVGAEVTVSPYSLPWNTTTSADGTHFLAAVARDSKGSLTVSNSVSVTVSNVSASNPPVISAVAAAPSSSGAIIGWTTDKPATSQVEYGATTSYGSQTALDSTLLTSHAATISGLSASTTYQFRVHSTDAGGNAAVSSNATFSTLSQSGLPTTLGWFQIPNSQLAPNCPSPNPGGACSNVIAAWGGGAADTKRNRLLIWGGGHVDYYGNEVYALDLNALTMRRIIDPTPNPVHCVEAQSDGHPSSRHTYDNLSYIAHVDKMFSFGGGLACDSPMAAVGSWTLDLTTQLWKRMDPVNGGSPDPSLGYAVSDYDPVSKSVFLENGLSLWSYSYDTNTWTQLNSSQVWNGMVGAVDPVRHLFVAFGLGKARVFNIAAGGNYAMQTLDTQLSSCSGLVNATYPGVAYDSRQGLIVGWPGGDTVYLFNPDTNTCTTKTFTGGPGAAQANGTYRRFAYFPSLNVFAIVNDWQQNAYTLRLTQ